MKKEKLPLVVLVGRTNVGKSSLFNRLTERKLALVSSIAGTTRDINRGQVEWEGRYLELVDTGGIDLSKPDDIEEKVIKQAWRELERADKVLLVTEAKTGLVAGDIAIAKQLRAKGINFVVVVNKADSPKLQHAVNDFYQLSPSVYPVSAANGVGTADLLDDLVKELGIDKSDEAPRAEGLISVAFAGVPNVGKSSLLNALIGAEEVIVSSQPHTTRESRDYHLEHGGHTFRLVDTAGIRKARKMRQILMRKSAHWSIDAIHGADWVIMVLDATEVKWGEQERYILNEIVKSGKSILMAANKWDLLEGEDRYEEFMDKWRRSFGTMSWIPVIPISAKTGWHVTRLLDTIIEMDENRRRQIPQSALDRLLKSAISRRRPQKKKGPEAPYIHTIKQVDTSPPTFEVVIQNQDTLSESYVRFLKKVLREKFDFTATPVRVYVRSVRTA